MEAENRGGEPAQKNRGNFPRSWSIPQPCLRNAPYFTACKHQGFYGYASEGPQWQAYCTNIRTSEM